MYFYEIFTFLQNRASDPTLAGFLPRAAGWFSVFPPTGEPINKPIQF